MHRGFYEDLPLHPEVANFLPQLRELLLLGRRQDPGGPLARVNLGLLHPVPDRELTIVEKLAEALKEMGGEYVLPFTFKNAAGTRTSHHLFFVSKHPLGYNIMKGIMAGESSSAAQGVASFQYSPADERFPMLFALSRPLDDLADDLLKKFSGRRLTVQQIFDLHNVGTPYIMPNYKAALMKLEAEGKITCDPADRPMRKGERTMADHVTVTFPKKRKSRKAREQ